MDASIFQNNPSFQKFWFPRPGAVLPGSAFPVIIISFQTLLAQAEYHSPVIDATDELDWVQYFRKGLREDLIKHGAFNKKTQQVFTSLLAFWEFLRTKVRESKDKAEIDKQFLDVQTSTGQVKSARELSRALKRKQAQQEGADKRPRPQGTYWEGPKSSAPAPPLESYTDEGRAHPSMPHLDVKVKLPAGYTVPFEPQDPPCQRPWDRIRHTCHSLYKGLHHDVPAKCLAAARHKDRDEPYCIIHGPNSHISINCPTVAAHFRHPLPNPNMGAGRGRGGRGGGRGNPPGGQGKGRGRGRH